MSEPTSTSWPTFGRISAEVDAYDGAEEIERAWRDGLKPDPLLTVSEWADRYRVLSQRASSEPGRWRTQRPYREHALISLQEHQAWDVLLACQGQLRLAPNGHVIGIDMSTALKLGAARGSDLAVLAELLPAAEADFVEAIRGEPG